MTSSLPPRRFQSFRLCALLVLAGALFAAPVQAQEAASPQGNASAQADSATAEARVEARGRFERRDPQRSRLFISSTARPIGSGAVYASALQVFFAQVGVGIGDAVSVEGGALLVPGEEFADLFRVTPKATLLERQTGALFGDGTVPLSVALDARVRAERQTYLYARPDKVPSFRTESEWQFSVAPRALATYGSPEAALTAGLGVAFGEGRGAIDGAPVATLGGEVQLLEWLKLLSENHVYFGVEGGDVSLSYDEGTQRIRPDVRERSITVAELSGGARFMWDHFSFEVAVLGATAARIDGSGYAVAPLLNFSYRF